MADQRRAEPRRTPSLSDEEVLASALQEIRQWSELLSKRTHQFNDLLGALHSLSLAAQDKELIKKIMSLLADLGKKPPSSGSSPPASPSPGNSPQASPSPGNSPPASPSPGSSPPSSPSSGPTGNLLYDLFTSPSMKSIVGEVLKTRTKKRW